MLSIHMLSGDACLVYAFLQVGVAWLVASPILLAIAAEVDTCAAPLLRSCTLHLQYIPFWALLGLAVMVAGCGTFGFAVRRPSHPHAHRR